MRKLLYLFLSITVFLSTVEAQDCSDVTATASVAPSACQSNGVITITFSGASADKLVNKQYSLKSTTGSLAIGPVSTNVFSNLPPGSYNLEAAGFCNSLTGESIVRTINNVIVTGSYQEPRLSFVAQGTSTNTASTMTSRKSYAGCSTGLIVVLLENGNQTTMPTFTITSAPEGVTVPQTVAATKATSGSATAGWRYLLDGTWPAGTYTVSANDGCYTASTSFIIEELTTVPPGSVSGSYIYTYGDGTDCSKFYYRPYYSYSSSSYPDWYRYYADGLYEYGIAPKGEMPKDENWFRVRYFNGGNSASYQDLFDLSPGKVSDYYTANSLTVYTRVKDCPSAIISSDTYNYNPFSMTSSTNICTGVRTYGFSYSKTSYPYYNVFCYPLTITVTDKSTGEIISSDSNHLFTDPNFSWSVNYGEDQYLNIIDASGYKILTNYSMSGVAPSVSRPSIILNNVSTYPEYNSCDSYKRTYYTGSGVPCEDESAFPCYVTITDDTGGGGRQDTLTTTSSKVIEGLQYGVLYTFTAIYPNWGNHTSTVTSNLKRSDHIPVSFSMTKTSTSACYENFGRLRVSSGSRAKSFKAGTIITITGPVGYIGQSYTYQSNIDGYTYDFSDTYLPPGEYTTTIISCGETYTISTTISGGYTVDKFDYTTEKDCMGLKLFPSGGISSNGTPLSTVYFRMTQVPSGSSANTKVIASTSNDYFLLTTAGTYILGMMTSNSLTGCAIKLDTIVYNPPPLALDRDKTSGYSCPSGETGYLTLKATNGVAPYTYTVFDEANTVQLTEPQSSESEINLGNFGLANETYTVRVSDACGNSFAQQVTLVSLDRAALAYGQSPVCYGTSISLNGFTVTNATYDWSGPNGFTSTEKNPLIPNATSVNEGWYKVKITSTACGVTVKDSIYIDIHEPISVADLDGTTQEVTLCPYQALIIGQAATGGSGNFTYQWAYNTSNLGTGSWSNLSGETNSTFKTTSTTYIFSSTNANPTRRYLRLAVTDTYCGSTYYLYYHTNVRGCMFLVNPDLKSPGTEN